MRLLHAADLHLDSPLRSQALRDPELARRLRGASHRRWLALSTRRSMRTWGRNEPHRLGRGTPPPIAPASGRWRTAATMTPRSPTLPGASRADAHTVLGLTIELVGGDMLFFNVDRPGPARRHRRRQAGGHAPVRSGRPRHHADRLSRRLDAPMGARHLVARAGLLAASPGVALAAQGACRQAK